MKKVLLAVLFFAGAAQAEDNVIRGLAGFSQSELGFGAQYEKANDDMGIGGYFFLSGDNKDVGKPDFMAIGAMASIYLSAPLDFKLHIAPGFGFYDVEYTASNLDDTSFGPSMSFGIEYRLNEKTHIGLQQSTYFNWMSDEMGNHFKFINASVRFRL